MIVVLEGCDGSGKTTLARYLCDKYGLKYHHEGPPPADYPPLEHYGSIVEAHRWAIARGNIKGVVFDRLALGERVYGEVYRNNDRLGADGWRVMKRLLRAAGAIQILCWPSLETCIKNWQARSSQEMIQDSTDLARVYDRYGDLFEQEPIGTLLCYDYTREMLPQLEYHMGERPKLPPGMLGAPDAKYLFVGEKGSSPTSLTTDLAFFGTTDSSEYLTKALDAAGYREEEIAFVNAERWDGQKVEWALPTYVIALGNKAAAECKTRHLSFQSVPHPQYWKRFHASEFNAYVEKLRAIKD